MQVVKGGVAQSRSLVVGLQGKGGFNSRPYNNANVAPSKVQNDGIEPALMKFIIVTQRVKIPPD